LIDCGIIGLDFPDRGVCAVVVPRGLFFNSGFFESMNSSDYSAFGPGNPLIGSMIMGNDNPLELNSRVVQQLIAANLTLEPISRRYGFRNRMVSYVHGRDSIHMAGNPST